ncbi:MAG: rod shape-determining protein RodA [bacterium]
MRLKDYDWQFAGSAAVLLGAGLLVLASSNQSLFYKQLVWIALAISIFCSLSFVNIRSLLRYRWIILGMYLVTLLIVVLTTFFAPIVAGTRSWLVLGPIHIQPSEFMKIALILLLAKFFSRRHVTIAHWSTIIVSAVYAAIPGALILIQPDLGTALVIFGIWFGYLLVSELPLKRVVVFAVIFLIIGLIGWYNIMEPYQKERIKALFNPNYDPLGVNYSVIQSRIAIGSGGFLGKGFGQGTQLQLGFLPESQTDFIFSAFVEEWGFLGGCIVIGAFVLFIHRILSHGLKNSDNIIRLVCLGTAIMLIIHFVINLGSVLGLLPVIGVSLPLMSYGGSNLLTVAILIGIIYHTAGKRVGF